jgi:murein DD-endopeptidase MepM/ murein hydrolase activator NlpD
LYNPHGNAGSFDFAGPDSGSAAIAAPLPEPAHPAEPGRQLLSRVNSLSDSLGEWRERLAAWLANADLAPDLAENIGSKRWFRGMGTMIGLAGAALLFWPDFTPAAATPPMRIDDQARDEFRSQMIMPLALGSDTGRRMSATAAVVPLRVAPERPRIELVATLAQGDSFARMLRRAGVGEGEADQVASMVSSAMPLSEITPGTKIDIVLGRRPAPEAARPLDSIAFRARFDLEIAATRHGASLALEQRPIRVDATPLRIRGKVGSSLYRSARSAGAPASAVQQYLRTLSEQFDLDRAMGANDEFDIIISYKRAATGEVEIGDLLYAGVLRNGKPRTQLMRWGSDGTFYEASGVGEQRSGLVKPVPGRVTSNYGMRHHPILGYSRMHKGVDFKAGYGTPIYAVTDGTVQMAGRNGGHGNYVKLNHGNGLQTGYSHMSRIAVSAGEHVRRGQVIGYVGATGLATGPHLHYEMFRNGVNVNPSSVNFVTKAQLSGRELMEFRGQLAELLTVEPGAALEELVPTRAEMATPEREIDRVNHPREIR